jgi:ketosteroid isomerase-like protein
LTQPLDEFLKEWADAERSGDATRLDALLTDDFLGVGPVGFVLPKAAWMARFRGGLTYESFELRDIQSRVHRNAAVITARQVGRGTIQGRPLPFEAVRVTLALVEAGGRWRLAGIHMSFIAGTPGAPPVPAPPVLAPPVLAGQDRG